MNKFYIEDKNDLRVLLVNRIIPKRIQYSGQSFERESNLSLFFIIHIVL